ncbi:chordin-like protein 2 [Macrobrachium nipponense]|uniref:chordin-like protein 2 n=1 Tax=Macrobrachium nipponense TaxID=159736 RepID=UPI0030C7AB2D
MASTVTDTWSAGERRVCRINNHEFQVGEVWHPLLRGTSASYCATCRCVLEDDQPNYKCESEQCPDTCTGEPDQSECCAICSGSSDETSSAIDASATASSGEEGGGGGSSSSSASSSSFASSSSSPPSSSTYKGRAVGETYTPSSCKVSGKLYRHGETFSSNYSDAVEEKCEQCYCNDGLTQCRTKTCPPILCSNPIYTTHDCCRTCIDSDSNDLNWDAVMSFSDPNSPKRKWNHDCALGNRYYTNGSIWHPILGPFGKMNCVVCRCFNYKIDCMRLKCPTREQLQCEQPVQVTGQCCKVCPLNPKTPGVPNGQPPMSGTMVRCLNARMDMAVWRNEGGGGKSSVLQHVFQPLQESDDLRMHQVYLQDGNVIDIRFTHITSVQFEDLRNKFQFTLVGATTRKLMDKFRKRVERFHNRCKEAAEHPSRSCTERRVKQLEKVLKTKPPQEKFQCNRGEKEI